MTFFFITPPYLRKAESLPARERGLKHVIAASDLCALVYSGRRLPGLLAEGGIAATPGDADVLSLLFPDTGAARCAQDAY